jgi:hypothetical protein
MAKRIAVMALKKAAEARINTSIAMRINHSSRSRRVTKLFSLRRAYHCRGGASNIAFVWGCDA